MLLHLLALAAVAGSLLIGCEATCRVLAGAGGFVSGWEVKCGHGVASGGART